MRFLIETKLIIFRETLVVTAIDFLYLHTCQYKKHIKTINHKQNDNEIFAIKIVDFYITFYITLYKNLM